MSGQSKIENPKLSDSTEHFGQAGQVDQLTANGELKTVSSKR